MSEVVEGAESGEVEGVEVSEASEFSPITSQEALDKIVQTRLARERGKYADYADLKAKATKYDEIQESSKTEIQKAMERAEKAESELQAKTLESERFRVIATHSIPEEFQDLITASDKEGMEAQAEKIQRLVNPRGPIVPTEGMHPSQTPGATDWLREQFQQN